VRFPYLNGTLFSLMQNRRSQKLRDASLLVSPTSSNRSQRSTHQLKSTSIPRRLRRLLSLSPAPPPRRTRCGSCILNEIFFVLAHNRKLGDASQFVSPTSSRKRKSAHQLKSKNIPRRLRCLLSLSRPPRRIRSVSRILNETYLIFVQTRRSRNLGDASPRASQISSRNRTRKSVTWRKSTSIPRRLILLLLWLLWNTRLHSLLRNRQPAPHLRGLLSLSPTPLPRTRCVSCILNKTLFSLMHNRRSSRKLGDASPLVSPTSSRNRRRSAHLRRSMSIPRRLRHPIRLSPSPGKTGSVCRILNETFS
jgi:hypothetical protein